MRSTTGGRGAAAADEELGRTDLLARRARAGDASSFQELYERVAPGLSAWARVRLNGGAAGIDPQDVFQDVWLEALQALSRYDPARGFRRWMHGIARRVLLQRFRRLSAEPPVRPEEELALVADAAPAVHARLNRAELARGVLAYLRELSDAERALVLSCGHGNSCSEVARELGISTSAVEKRWRRLRERMGRSIALRSLAQDAPL